MKQQRLGRTNLLTSQVGLGTVELGLDYGIKANDSHKRPEESSAIRLLHEALDHGIRFFDTARVYGNSEELIGKGLAGRREEYTLATKVAPFRAAELTAHEVREHVDSSIETSLHALRTDCVDLLMLHSATMEVLQNIAPIADAMREWQHRGCVRYLGASLYADVAGLALHSGGFDCVQIALNALDHEAEQTILLTATELDIGIVIRSALMKGILTPRYRTLPPEMAVLRQAAENLDQLAHAAGMSLPELAFRYTLHCDAVVLTGTARSQELNEAIEFANRGPLDPDLVAAIRAIQIEDRSLLNPTNWASSAMA